MLTAYWKSTLGVGIVACAILSVSCSEPEARRTTEFESIFDGQSFTGWKGDTNYWRIEDNSFVGRVSPENPLSANTFLIYDGKMPEDFELELEYKISAEGNSGVQYRSELVDGIPFALRGYQADIDGENVYTGQNYEERGRGFLAMRGQSVELQTGQTPLVKEVLADTDSLKSLIKTDDWNTLIIRAEGYRLEHFINGVKMSETLDKDEVNRKKSGLLGLQLHVAPQMEVRFRNIKLKALAAN
ncbi:MAG TPA: DUF1080 domain-containing protein [Flavihumibacter sp.]|jgi:hypothetical protein